MSGTGKDFHREKQELWQAPLESWTRSCHQPEWSGSASSRILFCRITDKLFPFLFRCCREMTKSRTRICANSIELKEIWEFIRSKGGKSIVFHADRDWRRVTEWHSAFSLSPGWNGALVDSHSCLGQRAGGCPFVDHTLALLTQLSSLRLRNRNLSPSEMEGPSPVHLTCQWWIQEEDPGF